MTAAEAVRDARLRRRVADAAHASDRAVKDLLRGFPPYLTLGNAIRAELAREGVDLGTIQARTDEELEEHRCGRRPKCRECARLREENAALRRQLEDVRRSPASPPKLGVVPAVG